MPPICDVRVRLINNFHRHRRALAGGVLFLAVLLDRDNIANMQTAEGGDTEGRTDLRREKRDAEVLVLIALETTSELAFPEFACFHLEDAIIDLAAYNDRVLLVEDVLWQDFDYAGEHGYGSRISSPLLRDLLHVPREVVEKVVDYLGGEDLNDRRSNGG